MPLRTHHTNELLALAFAYEIGQIAHRDIHTRLAVVHRITFVAGEIINALGGSLRAMHRIRNRLSISCVKENVAQNQIIVSVMCINIDFFYNTCNQLQAYLIASLPVRAKACILLFSVCATSLNDFIRYWRYVSNSIYL